MDEADGTVWVADTGNNELVRLRDNGDRTTTELLRIGGFSAPESVCVNPADRTLWVADTGHAQIVHLSSDGTELLRAGGFTEPWSVSANSSDGTCWVADRTGGEVVHLRDNGDGTATPLLRDTRTTWPAAVSVNSGDGTCWVADSLYGDVRHLRDNGDGTASQLARDGSSAWSNSVSVHVSDGTCWVAKTSVNSAAVRRIRDNGDGTTTTLTEVPTGDSATNVAAAVDGTCWVAGRHSVEHFGPNGARLASLPPFWSPSSLSVNASDGSCWVSEMVGMLPGVTHLDASGAILARSGEVGSPSEIATNSSDGTCWIIDRSDFMSGGMYVVHLQDDGDGTLRELARIGGIYEPAALSVDPTDGTCWVAGGGDNTVRHLRDNGDGSISVLGTASSIWTAQSVSVDPSDGTCWASSWGSWELVRLRDNGDGTISELARGEGAISSRYLSVDASDGSCWAQDDNGSRVLRVRDNGSGGIEVVSQSVGFPTGVYSVAAAEGTCWVGQGGSGVVLLGDNGDGTMTVLATLGTYEYPSSLSANTTDASVWVADSEHGVVSHLATTAPPVADFSASPRYGVGPLVVGFTEQSLGAPTNWLWSFGDGTTSTEPDPDHTYTTAGVYAVTLTVQGAGGTDVESKLRHILVSFPDVPFTPTEYWALYQILACVDAGIVQGYWDGYHPEQSVTRDQMAVYISRALAGGDANVQVPSGVIEPSFPDVPADHWAYRHVEYCKNLNIVAGYWDGYHPSDVVTRAQMAVYVARSVVDPTGEDGLSGYTPPATATFSDVATDYWAYKHVEYCKSQSIVSGYWDGYHPEEAVNRAQMAVYVTRAFGLPM